MAAAFCMYHLPIFDRLQCHVSPAVGVLQLPRGAAPDSSHLLHQEKLECSWLLAPFANLW